MMAHEGFRVKGFRVVGGGSVECFRVSGLVFRVYDSGVWGLVPKP